MKQILFNTSMVRAILDGEKTCTRRIIKLPKYIEKQRNGLYLLCAEGSTYSDKEFKDVIDYINPPYKVGDILYVRETWNINPSWEFDKNYIKLPSKESKYIYKATSDFNGGWKPSIHMPKEAARIFLKVTSVRAERLKDITDEGCYQEGISSTSFYDEAEHIQIAGIGLNDSLERAAFGLLWNSTVKEDKYSWEGNPWVWVIEFEVENKGGEINE
ncbi:hypothetical protein [Clostridium perfringens]|uniref:Uncharacterized protein n=1 Tax=Clostridium perfringens TaxID=1502 RepID=A0AAP4A964_CLOPF|nr:hypothetical protein [Clostridium perfringens]MDH2337329.1 hypothetical protein [Clostridium perfringens]